MLSAVRAARDFFAEAGPLAQSMTGYAVRPEQQRMSECVAEALQSAATLLIEAGTGTGKTFAYLVPVLQSKQRVIISTGTKNLQDQLYFKDLPAIQQAVSCSRVVARLKGRRNYLCWYRFQQQRENPYLEFIPDQDRMSAIAQWSLRTRSGDLNEVAGFTESDPLWSAITSTADNCLGQACPEFSRCFLAKARQEAQKADIVIVNHHLFFADMALQEEGFGELLPQADAVILDEAHQIPDIASQFLSEQFSSRQIDYLLTDIQQEYTELGQDMPALPECCTVIEHAVFALRQALGEAGQRDLWQIMAKNANVQQRVQALGQLLTTLLEHLEPLEVRSPGFERCYERAQGLTQLWRRATSDMPADCIHWFETYRRAFAIHLTPMSIAEPFQACVGKRSQAWILTSATLATAGDMSHFINQLGFSDVSEEIIASPYDFKRQCLLYVPRGLPEPQAEHYVPAMMDVVLPVLQASGGRAFVLFTSHRALREAADCFASRCDYPLFIQGQAAKGELLTRFREHGNAVLLATGSFWEGVDVRGDALSCVVIDRLPFSTLSDPVLRARLQALRDKGGEPFSQQQIPQAVIALKQGIGRLIRDDTDRGVLMICDPRIVGRDYGRAFISSLPSMPRTRLLSRVCDFFGQEETVL